MIHMAVAYTYQKKGMFVTSVSYTPYGRTHVHIYIYIYASCIAGERRGVGDRKKLTLGPSPEACLVPRETLRRAQHDDIGRQTRELKLMKKKDARITKTELGRKR